MLRAAFRNALPWIAANINLFAAIVQKEMVISNFELPLVFGPAHRWHLTGDLAESYLALLDQRPPLSLSELWFSLGCLSFRRLYQVLPSIGLNFFPESANFVCHAGNYDSPKVQ